MEQTLLDSTTEGRQEYKEWLLSLRANTQRVEQEEHEATEWRAKRQPG
jgi:hypothetical protein